jgi:hypothetical protein
VSRRHAQLQRTDQGDWLLQDLNSLNGIFFKGEKVQQIVLEPGRHVKISDYELTLCLSQTQQELPPPGPAEDSSPSWPGLEPGWLEQLQQFQRVLLRQEDSHRVLELLGEQVQRICRPQGLAVGLAHAEGYTWEVLIGSQGEGFSSSLSRAGKRADNSDSDVQCWTEGAAADQTPNPASPYCVLFPMKGRAGIIGHVYVYRPRLLPMPPSLQRYLSLYANYAGLLWENLQVITLRSNAKKLEHELLQARQIQIESFPPTFDVDPRLCAFGVNLPSVHVSGDYYDLIRTGQETVAFVIADAMGHGMPAALMMASVRATLRMGLSLGMAWEALFRGVDNIIAQARVTGFVTGLIGQVDLEVRELQLVIAGHHPPSILVGGKPVVVPEECRTRPWGVDCPSEWQVGRVPLGDADWSVLCFTDGITEAVIRPDQMYGTRRVDAFHLENHELCAEDICQGLLTDVSEEKEADSLADDQTVLVLRSAL